MGQESVELKRRVDALEAENRELKRSVFELSTRLGQLQWLLNKARARPFEVEAPEIAAAPEVFHARTAAGGKHANPGALHTNNSHVVGGDIALPKSAIDSISNINSSASAGFGQHMQHQNGSNSASHRDGRSLDQHIQEGQGQHISAENKTEQQQNGENNSMPLASGNLRPRNASIFNAEPGTPQGGPFGELPGNSRMMSSSAYEDGRFGRDSAVERAINAFMLPLETQRSSHAVSYLNPLERSTEFTEHAGAVYCCKWAPNGRWLASGSFDNSVVVRPIDVDNLRTSADTKIKPAQDSSSSASAGETSRRLTGHTQLVSDVKWSCDGSMVLTGSFDQTARVWDLTRAHAASTSNGTAGGSSHVGPLQTFKLEGFVQTIETDRTQPMVFYAGTSKGNIVVLDGRSNGGSTAHFRTSRDEAAASGNSNTASLGMINVLHIPSHASQVLLSGSAKGVVQAWDMRMQAPLENFTPLLNEHAGRPITNLTTTMGADGRHLLAVNCYDNVLRVYHSENILARNGSLEPSLGHSVFNLLGHRNKNWPIRASFFSPHASPELAVASASPRTVNAPRIDPLGRPLATLLATGSASTSVYVFSLTSQEAQLLYKLKGHSGRVYACEFAPSTDFPLLATSSADATVRLWLPAV